MVGYWSEWSQKQTSPYMWKSCCVTLRHKCTFTFKHTRILLSRKGFITVTVIKLLFILYDEGV